MSEPTPVLPVDESLPVDISFTYAEVDGVVSSTFVPHCHRSAPLHTLLPTLSAVPFLPCHVPQATPLCSTSLSIKILPSLPMEGT